LQGWFGRVPVVGFVSQFRVLSDRNVLRAPPRNMYSTVNAKFKEKMHLKTDKEISAYYRGSIIQEAIEIELRMDIIIGRFLSANNQKLTRDTINIFDTSESIGFFAKNMAIQYITKNYFADFLKINKKFLTDLEFLINKRNLVAHKRPEIETNDFTVLCWNKTSGMGKFLLNEKSYSDYMDKAICLYAKLIELEVLIMEKYKNKE